MAGLEGEDPPIVHRDLKPSNVFVDGAGAARVADMNLSLRLNEDSLALLTGETGTYLYMSPEMMRHEVWPSSVVMLIKLPLAHSYRAASRPFSQASALL